MRPMPEPFEPSDTPRLMSPAELAIMVKFLRQLRSWSQEALAAEAGITARTLQRVEAGQPSDVQTRRAIARAFGSKDLDTFNKAWEFPSFEQLEERTKREEEERNRNWTKLSTTIANGRLLIELAARIDAFCLGQDRNFEVPPNGEKPAAELQDYMHDAVDIADEIGAVGRLDMAEDLNEILKRLSTLGVSVIMAEQDAKVRLGDRLVTMTTGHLALCQKGREPETVWVLKDMRATF